MGKRLSVLLLASMLLSLLVPAAQAAGAAGGIDVYFYEEAAGAYGALTQTDLVTLTLDGAPLAPDGVPALVQYLGSDGRTLVPVRLIAEKLGAAVTWVPDTRQVLILESGRNIVLTLGSSTALVNGQTVELPGGVPAGVVKWDGLESTMVPLRFVSEQLGATVDWDNDSFTASLTSPGASVTPEPSPGPSPTPSPTPSPSPALPPVPSGDDRGYITGVSSDSDTQTVLIETDHVPEYRVLDLGDRVAVDVLGAVLHSGEAGMVTIPVDNDMITAVRYYQHGDDLGYGYPHTVRVVLDLKSGITYSKNLKVEAGSSGVRVTAFLTDGDREDTDFTPSAPIDPSKSTIVLDAGHGGARAGAVYPDASGTEVLEKDLALSMTLKLRDRLVAAGYNVVLTRESDVEVDLYERADIANAVGADLFISIHCNASGTVPSFQGIYTYYHPSSGRGKRLAEAIQTPLCAATGAIDRGVKDADFVVLRETEMCAVLVETGFMSNSEELARLCDGAYQDKVALGIAEGAIRYLNGLNTAETSAE